MPRKRADECVEEVGRLRRPNEAGIVAKLNMHERPHKRTTAPSKAQPCGPLPTDQLQPKQRGTMLELRRKACRIGYSKRAACRTPQAALTATQAESVLQTDEWAWLRSPRFSAIGEKLLCSAKPRLFDRRRSAQRLEGVFAPKYVMAGVETN